MRLKFVQKFIDKLRKKNKTVSVEEIMHNVINELLNNGYIINEKESIFITSNNVKFKYNSNTKDALIYTIYEDFYKKEYGIIFDSDSIFIDVGLNIATTSLYFASLEKVKKVYAFEPFTPTYNDAMININLNPELAKKIETFNIGLDKENKEIEMPYNISQSGCMSSIYNPFEFNKQICKKVESTQKLKICDSAEILAPIINKHYNKEQIILKIDTEGSEFNIFESLEKESLFSKVDIIMLEYHYKSPKFLEEILLKNNFTVIYNPEYNKDVKVGMIFAFKNRKAF